MGNIPTIEAVSVLHDRIFATLTPEELEILDFYRDQGRKFGVSIQFALKGITQEELKAAGSKQKVDQLLKRTNNRVSVAVSEQK